MVGCAAPMCSNHSRNKKKADVKGWHYIPRELCLRKKWIVAMRRDPPYPKDTNFALCGLHFTDDCFLDDPKAKYGGMAASFKLKEDAVPSVFEFSKQIKRRRTSEHRRNKREKTELVNASLEQPVIQINLDATNTSCSSSQHIEQFEDDYDFDGDDKSIIDHDSSFRIGEEEAVNSDAFTGNFDFLFVRLDKLKLLLKFCMQCGSPATVTNCHTIGATVFISIECTSGHKLIWDSLNYDHKKINDHTILSAAILLSGSTYQPFSESMKIAKVQFFEKNTFYRIQSNCLFPAVNNIYQRKAREILQRTICQGPVALVGDGRCDSPGFSATYGTYTLMNEKNNEILDYFIAHVRLAGNSQNMEKYGLKFLMEYFTVRGLKIDSLTTDQHLQIRKYLREEYPDVCHQYDIWHKSKNIRKKLEKVAKKKAFQDLQPWLKSIINHFWWSCANCKGDVDKLRDMWTSLLSHIRNVHKFPRNKSTYKSCAHQKLSKRQKLSKKWLKKSSPAYAALENIILDEKLMSDLPHLVNFKHSGNIEVYHNVIGKYCPKRLSFSYEGMHARTQLAIMSHNSSINRKQAVSKKNKHEHKSSIAKSPMSGFQRK